MFCPKCGNKLNGNEDFCSNCGNKIVEAMEQSIDSKVENSSQQPVNTMSEMMSKKSQNFIKPIIQKLKNFIVNYKRQCLIGFSGIAILIVGLVLFNNFFGFDKLSWNEEYSDFKLEYVSQTNIKLGINFKNKEKVKDIKYDVTCGEVKNNGLEVNWNLSKSTGQCKITASYKLRKISKEFKIINFNTSEQELVLDYKIDLDSDEDLDFDGLTNKQEKEYKTSPILSDTDMDGLDDYYEIFTSKTDPLKADTDGDGLNDYDEIQLGLDPLKADSKGDGVKDGKRTMTYNLESNNLKVSITGAGNIASTIAEVNTNTKISSKTGLIDNLYTLYTDGTITEAVITIAYTDEELVKYGLNEDNLSIYYYNEKKAKYEKIETVIDKENNTLTATLKHFSNYVVGDTTLVKETTTTQVLFVLDNSWSMYTNEQYKNITGEEYSGGLFGSSKLDGFDADGVRFTLTSDLITRLSKKSYQIGLSEFRSDYANALKIGTDADTLKSKLKTMNGSFLTTSAGTNISNALTSGIREFSKDSDNKYIVILTDGQDSSLSSQTKKIIEKANENEVKICSIGFGGGSYNTELSNISNGTGCKFYSSGNVDGLTELFENIGAELDDDLVDINGDGEADGILVADSGFIVNRDGFSFSNYGTNLSSGGHCYGMATFAQLYYKKQLPLTVGSKTAGDQKSYAYDLSDTYFKNYNNLYDYKLQTNALKYTFGYDIFGETQPADLRTLDGTKLTFTEKYKKEIGDSGIYDMQEQKTGLSKEKQLERWGVNYETADNLYLNEDKMQTSKIMKKDDTQMFNAIWTGFIRQNTTTHYSSGSNFLLWLRNVIGTESTDYTGAQGFINILKSRLNDKDAPVISSSYSGGLHAINAISLVQDIENPNYYYIGVYDNNYPGEKRYVDIKCNKDTCSTVANDYYTESGQPIRITPSLEYDLAYYK